MQRLLFFPIFFAFAAHLLAQNPHGETLRLDCGVCHDPNGWEIEKDFWEKSKTERRRISKISDVVGVEQQLNFDHDLDTDFPLTDRHAALECSDCHNDLVFTGASSECVSCHQDLHQMTVGNDCARCHTMQHWLVDDVTQLHVDNGFPLIGMHATLDCAECHVSDSWLRFDRLGNDCINCHLQDYQATTMPNHQAAGYSTDCLECHRETAWQPAVSDHDGQYFPIYSGNHAGAWSDCTDCHINPNNFAIFSCIDCHEHNNPNDLADEHQGVPGYSYNSTSCLVCHPTGDEDGAFNHDNTAFPLTGAHLTTDCIQCHANGYAGTPTECVACHQADYNATTDPNHVLENFSTNCTVCHSTDAWQPSIFNHDNVYPLRGAHKMIENDCARCHLNDDFSNTPNTCIGCHQSDYAQATNPDHNGFSTDCAQCHSEDAWSPAINFDHDAVYPLKGAHKTVENQCALCHINGNFNNTPTDCFACHQDDYNQANDPSHAGFPTDCAQCHTETAWEPANFDHNGFPIYSGNHKQGDAWNNCNECHTTPNNYMVFSCIDCHEHNDPNDLADEHDGVQNYQYASPACYSCHPDGNE